MMETILATLTTLLVPWLVGILTRWLTNLAKNMETFAASGNGWKRFVVVLISTVLTAIFSWAGVEVTGSPFHLDGNSLNVLATALLTGLSALISAVYAMTVHNGEKVSKISVPEKPADGTPSIPVNRPTI